ncbi:hypothetical protein P4S70_00315 [Enterovibrio sp. Hal110]
MDYKGGTYLSQGLGNTLEEGMSSAVLSTDFSNVSDFSSIDKQLLIETLNENGLAKLDGLKNAFCSTALIDDSLVIAHLVTTAET